MSKAKRYAGCYIGYTYCPILANRLCLWLWKKLFCRFKWHLWDEVWGEEHYLYCDACGESIGIKRLKEIEQ
jgi:hypothetical protein